MSSKGTEEERRVEQGRVEKMATRQGIRASRRRRARFHCQRARPARRGPRLRSPLADRGYALRDGLQMLQIRLMTPEEFGIGAARWSRRCSLRVVDETRGRRGYDPEAIIILHGETRAGDGS